MCVCVFGGPAKNNVVSSYLTVHLAESTGTATTNSINRGEGKAERTWHSTILPLSVLSVLRLCMYVGSLPSLCVYVGRLPAPCSHKTMLP